MRERYGSQLSTSLIYGSNMRKTKLLSDSLMPGQSQKNVENVQKFEFLPKGVKVLKLEFSQTQCFLLSTSGRLFNWGLDSFGGKRPVGQETIPKEIQRDEFQHIHYGEKIIDISVGLSHILVLTSEGRIFAWGFNNLGQLGNGNHQIKKISSPQLIQFFQNKYVYKIYAAGECSFALTIDNNDIDKTQNIYRVFSWGDNRQGQLGVQGVFHAIPQEITSFPISTMELEIYYNNSDKITYFYSHEGILNYSKQLLEKRNKEGASEQLHKDAQKIQNFQQENYSPNTNTFSPFQTMTNEPYKQIRIWEYKINQIQKKIQQQQDILKDLQEKNNEDLNLDQQNIDNPVVKDLDKLLQEQVEKKEQHLEQSALMQKDLYSLKRDYDNLYKQLNDITIKEDTSYKQKQSLIGEINNKKTSTAKKEIYKRQLKAIREVTIADETQKYDLQKRVTQIKESICEKEEILQQMAFQINEQEKNILTHKQLLQERKIIAKKQKNAGENTNKFDITKIIPKINHFQKILKETTINELAKKNIHLDAIDNLISESDKLINKINTELKLNKQQCDSQSDLLIKFLEMFEKNADIRKKINQCQIGLMVPTSNKLKQVLKDCGEHYGNEKDQELQIKNEKLLFQNYFKSQNVKTELFDFQYQFMDQEL